MLRGIITLVFTVTLAFPSILLASGSNSTACATKYPIVLAHGMGAQAKILGVISYWADVPGALEDHAVGAAQTCLFTHALLLLAGLLRT